MRHTSASPKLDLALPYNAQLGHVLADCYIVTEIEENNFEQIAIVDVRALVRLPQWFAASPDKLTQLGLLEALTVSEQGLYHSCNG